MNAMTGLGPILLPALPPAISLRGVGKTFGGATPAVRDVSLDIGQGEIFGIAGRSGAGKSTLLRLVNLLERPDGGTVTVAGQELTALGKRALRDARRRIGMIFQQFNLLQNATVAANVALPLILHGARNRAQTDARVAQCLALVDLGGKAQAYPAQLSGGQRQRVAIARALATGPAVLLCDEPTSALDAQTTRTIVATLRDVNARLGVTIVVVSHELDVLAQLCGRVAVLADGAVAEIVRPHDGQALTALGRELVALHRQVDMWADREAADA